MCMYRPHTIITNDVYKKLICFHSYTAISEDDSEIESKHCGPQRQVLSRGKNISST